MTRNHCPKSSEGRQVTVRILALLVAATVSGTGCRDSCTSKTKDGATPCYSDHEILSCRGDPNGEGGQSESRSACPTKRPVCRQDPNSRSGACVSVTPLMCVEQLVATVASDTRIEVADLDGDGLDDIVFEDAADLRAAVARADGSFSPSLLGSRGPLLFWTLADVTGDRIPDLINATTDGTTTVAPGIGVAAFGPPQPMPALSGNLLAKGDFDGDGAVDFIDWVNRADGGTDISVHLAAAGFAAGQVLQFALKVGAYDLEAFPLRAGQHQWVLEIIQSPSLEIPASGELHVIGDATGAVLTTISAGTQPADYDGDGITDLIINQSIALGDGAGHFATDPSRNIGPFAVVPADFDGDGTMDLEQIDAAGSSTTLSALHGTGGGRFAPQPPIYVERYIESVRAVPIHVANRPGTDLVVVAISDTGGGEVRILRGDCR